MIDWRDCGEWVSLKPCPFCGSDRVAMFRQYRNSLNYISCQNCGASTKVLVGIDGIVTRELINLWNRRSGVESEEKVFKSCMKESYLP